MSLEYRPDDEVINDDARLDAWYDAFVRDMARKAGRKDPRFALVGEGGQGIQIPEFGGG